MNLLSKHHLATWLCRYCQLQCRERLSTAAFLSLAFKGCLQETQQDVPLHVTSGAEKNSVSCKPEHSCWPQALQAWCIHGSRYCQVQWDLEFHHSGKKKATYSKGYRADYHLRHFKNSWKIRLLKASGGWIGKAFAVQPANPSSIPETYMVEGENHRPQVTLWLLHVHTPTPNKKNVQKNWMHVMKITLCMVNLFTKTLAVKLN